MLDLTKLATYLDSFEKGDPNYDTACFIKSKIATDLQDRETINNGEEDDLTDNDITMSTPDQQSSKNQEGEMMDGVFQELDALNQIKEEKEEIKLDPRQEVTRNPNLDSASPEDFGNNSLNTKQATLFQILQKKLNK